MKFPNLKNKKGFTLIEMMVAVFVFAVIMTIATGAILTIVNANKTSQALKSVMDNLSSAIDSMSRNIRYGSVYNCGAGSFVASASCINGGTSFSFRDRLDKPTIYKYVNEAIVKCDDVGNCINLTAPEVHITDMHFYVDGANENESRQPQLLITIAGYAQAGRNRSEFNIETMVDQRNLTLCKDVVPASLRDCI